MSVTWILAALYSQAPWDPAFMKQMRGQFFSQVKDSVSFFALPGTPDQSFDPIHKQDTPSTLCFTLQIYFVDFALSQFASGSVCK